MKNCLSCIKYRLPIIREKGAIFLIVWNVFYVISLFSSGSGLLAWKYTAAIEYTILMILFPIVGFVADCWVGKYKVLKVGLYVLLISIIFKAIGTLILPIMVLSYIEIAFQLLSLACYSNTIPFTIEQFVGASGEELSFTIYWLIWGCVFGALVALGIPRLVKEGIEYVSCGVASLSLLVAVCMMECCNHYLMTKPQLSNPIKHIAKVLNYARKHKYPKKRSALTYWEDDYPSRIDLGKDKYGGPFTVEEVEDVKTVLRLIPMILITTSYVATVWSKSLLKESPDQFKWYSADSFTRIFSFAALISTVSLPIYHFFVYPFFYNYIPSMLKKIGIGIFLTFISFFSSSILEITFGHQNATCVLVNGELEDTLSLTMRTGPDLLYCIGFLVLTYTLIEFLAAQSPFQIKGIIFTLMVAGVGLYTVVGIAFDVLLRMIAFKHFPNCMFYNYIIHSIALIIILLLFIVVSKWYKLRKRDDIVPYHMLAENYFMNNSE